MVRVALFVRLEAKPGKEKDVEEFLRGGLAVVEREPATTTWFALRLGASTFGIFDAFPDEAGRQAHLSGQVAAALMAKALELQEEKQAVAQYEQTILVAFREVEDALVGVSTAREQGAAQERQVNALRSALHLASLRYKGGLANYLDVLIAQRNLFDAELALAATHRLHLVSVVQLYKALGGGWSPDKDQGKDNGKG